jgi:hypothetical protein
MFTVVSIFKELNWDFFSGFTDKAGLVCVKYGLSHTLSLYTVQFHTCVELVISHSSTRVSDGNIIVQGPAMVVRGRDGLVAPLIPFRQPGPVLLAHSTQFW